MLKCDRCGKEWNLSDNNIGVRCGIRLGSAEWCDGKLIGRAARIEAAARKLLEALPRCRYDGLDVSEPCQARAMWVCFDLTCAPEFRCDGHKYEHDQIGGCFDHAKSHPAWWADAARELEKALEGR